MAKQYGDASRQAPAHDRHYPPEPDGIVVDGLRDWYRAVKQQPPQPCPTNYADCAKWWREQMQEPEKPRETFEAPTSGGSGTRWDCGYAVRLRSTLLRFLALTPAERTFIVAARDDGVFWRGEDPEHFADVVERVMRGWGTGVDVARTEALQLAHELNFNMPAEKALDGNDTGEIGAAENLPPGSAEWREKRFGIKRQSVEELTEMSAQRVGRHHQGFDYNEGRA